MDANKTVELWKDGERALVRYGSEAYKMFLGYGWREKGKNLEPVSFDDMTKAQLEGYARQHFGVELDRRKTRSSLQKACEALLLEGE